MVLAGQTIIADQGTKQGPREVEEDHPQTIEPEDRLSLLNSEALFLVLA